jgi:DNA-binding transcriptional MerR regulator
MCSRNRSRDYNDSTIILDIMTVYCYNNGVDEKRYTIDELSDLTGFSRRTIRYYIQQGLLEPPAGRGRGGFYYDSHVETLKRIKALQEDGFNLGVIAQRLDFAPQYDGNAVETPRSVWIRYEIIPGVELNITRDQEERQGKKVTEIVRLIRSMLKEDGQDD